jgi:hypothetical protein
LDNPKYTYTKAIQAQLAEIEPMICSPSPNAAWLASIFYGMAMNFQQDIDRHYATNGNDWPALRDKNFAKAKFYWETLL